MAAGHNPGFVRDARSIGAEGHIVSASFYDAQVLTFLLRQNVAEDAALFAFEIVASGAEFVEDAARHEGGRGQLGCGVLEFLSGFLAMILENADVLEPAVALQILNPLRGQAQELFDFEIARIPEMAVVAGIFDQNFVSADRSHAIVEAVGAAGRLAFDVVERMRMDDRARRPCAAIHAGQVGDDMSWLGGRAAKPAGLGAWSRLDDLVTGDHPGTGDGIFTEFHGVRRAKSTRRVKWSICNLRFVICNLKAYSSSGRHFPDLSMQRIANYQITNYKLQITYSLCPSPRRR